MKPTYPCFLANQAETPNTDLEVRDKFLGTIATRVPQVDSGSIDRAIGASAAAARPMAAMAPFERQAVLLHCVGRFEERAEELAQALRVEAGKPIKDSRGEVDRLIQTFRIAAEEAVRPHGEMLELEISARSKGYRGWTKRVPVGPCSFISPFNFPLNLAAHKIAPAIAAGCPFILKPASRTPVGALLIGEALAATDLPPGAFSILPCAREGADLFATDERLKLLSFTGSPDVGWKLKAKAGKKKVVLELGGNAACIIDEGADLEDAVARTVFGAFYQSGQSCISVQRILAHQAVAEEFTSRFVAAAKALKAGDPSDESVFVGPLIAEAEAERLENWIRGAVADGAELLCGGRREGAVLEATVLRNVPREHPLCAEEAFGPVVVIETCGSFDEALAAANASRFGIHAGVFTPSLPHALRAWDELEVGGVLINEMPSWRVDNMPYGGVKDSGVGREGVRYAMEDMTEPRALVIRT